MRRIPVFGRAQARRRLALLVPGALAALVALCLPSSARAEAFYRVVHDVNLRAGPSSGDPVIGVLPVGAVVAADTCNANWCFVRQGDVAGWASRRFLVTAGPAAAGGGEIGAGSVGEPESVAVAPPPAPAAAARRTVYPDGTLEILNANGFGWRRLPSGDLVIVHPDGSTSSLQNLQAQSSDPPPLPPEYERWTDSMATRLIATLKNILTPGELTAYLRTEQGRSGVGLIRWRIDSIEFLTRPGS